MNFCAKLPFKKDINKNIKMKFQNSLKKIKKYL